MIAFIIATHGPLAEALLASGQMVYGELPHVSVVTLSEQAGIEGFRQDFTKALASAGQNADGVVVLCDLQSGTPWNVACQHAFSPQMTSPVAVLAGVFPIGTLEEMVNIGTLFAFSLVSIGVIVLRRTRPEMPRPYRVPWSPVLPVIGVLFAVYLMSDLPLSTWIRFVVWMVIGVIIYFAYSRRHSMMERRSRGEV